MPDYNKIIDFFDECIEHYKELLSFENKKLEYITSNNVDELSNGLGREQALIMKGNSLETKRVEILKKQGVSDIKFKELIESAPDEFSGKLNARYLELLKYINEVKRINGYSLNMVEEKLNYIEERISQNNSTYDMSGEKKHAVSSGSAISKNV